MERKDVKYLIIGAGVSGLSFANYCNDYLIVEKDDKIGGYCRTTVRNGYVWDYAGHFFHFSSEEFKNKFLKVIPKSEIIYKDKCTKIMYKNNLIDYPFQTNIHELPKEEFIDCLYDLFNKEEKDSYDNFLDMLYGKFGKSITEKFLKPYNEKLYACDLSLLDTNAMGRFFPYANKEAIINNMRNHHDSSYNNSFLYPQNGAITFMNVLYNNLDKSKVLLNTKIKSIDKENKVANTDTLEIHYEYLINTSPLNNFLNLLGSEYHDLRNELSYNQVLVFNMGFDKKSKFNKEHWLYFPDKDINFYRIGFYDNILDSDKLSLYVEIGYPKDAVITESEINKEKNLTIDSLKKTGIIDDTFNLIDYETIVMTPAYVHIETKTDEKVHKTFNDFANDNIYSIGRYGAWTYCSMEDCMIKAKELAEKLR